jgi:hypothetical protein
MILTQTTMIGIFKTNINTPEERNTMISAILDQFEVGHCNIDLEDCDKVLRITEMKVPETTIINFVQQQGFYCETLD